MPYHVEVGFLFSIKSCSDSVAEPACQHESPEKGAGLLDDGWNDENDQPAHDEIKSQAKFFIDLLGENLIQNPKNSCPPLD